MAFEISRVSVIIWSEIDLVEAQNQIDLIEAQNLYEAKLTRIEAQNLCGLRRLETTSKRRGTTIDRYGGRHHYH